MTPGTSILKAIISRSRAPRTQVGFEKMALPITHARPVTAERLQADRDAVEGYARALGFAREDGDRKAALRAAACALVVIDRLADDGYDPAVLDLQLVSDQIEQAGLRPRAVALARRIILRGTFH